MKEKGSNTKVEDNSSISTGKIINKHINRFFNRKSNQPLRAKLTETTKKKPGAFYDRNKNNT